MRLGEGERVRVRVRVRDARNEKRVTQITQVLQLTYANPRSLANLFTHKEERDILLMSIHVGSAKFMTKTSAWTN